MAKQYQRNFRHYQKPFYQAAQPLISITINGTINIDGIDTSIKVWNADDNLDVMDQF